MRRALNLIQVSADLVRWKATGIAVIVAFCFAFSVHPLSTSLLSAIVVGALCGAALAINDACDVAIDVVNAPLRPIPSGRASRRGALLLGAALLVSAVSLAATRGLAAFSIAFIVSVLAILYSFFLKPMGLPGNVAGSAMCSAIFPYVGIGSADLRLFAHLGCAAFLFVLGRELVLDTLHLSGDRASFRRTLPLVWDERRTTLLAAYLFLSAGLVLIATTVTLRQDLSLWAMAFVAVTAGSVLLGWRTGMGLRAVIRFTGIGGAISAVFYVVNAHGG